MIDFNTKEDDVYLYKNNYITIYAVKNDWNDYDFYDKFKDGDLNL